MFHTSITYNVKVIRNKFQHPQGADKFNQYLEQQTHILCNSITKKLDSSAIKFNIQYTRDFTNTIISFVLNLEVLTSNPLYSGNEFDRDSDYEKLSAHFLESTKEANPDVKHLHQLPYKVESLSFLSNFTNKESANLNEKPQIEHKKNYFGILEETTMNYLSITLAEQHAFQQLLDNAAPTASSSSTSKISSLKASSSTKPSQNKNLAKVNDGYATDEDEEKRITKETNHYFSDRGLIFENLQWKNPGTSHGKRDLTSLNVLFAKNLFTHLQDQGFNVSIKEENNDTASISVQLPIKSM